ncbi:hypothetical protein [Olivibacter domesticus]|uniref:Uncharacterized protein n=1 Tax=Olivibacter domesticus TaxID=407022 RepID=A0A1H7RBE6_OLID1|nr:hypothetical protein [Olivibacter domesticus]SEL57596.1 hypothetical protein SAMN05661044_02921 [Olivibacter domesticus]
MRLKICFRAVFFFVWCFFQLSASHAQYQAFIYGKVTLKNKQIYSGPIKWSGDQRLWSDVLVVKKTTHNALRYLTGAQRKQLLKDGEGEEIDWKFMSLWKDKEPKRKVEVLCRFGDMKMVHVMGNNKAQIYFKNGEKLRVESDENDNRHLGKNIVVYYNGDSETVHWNEISTVEFLEMPKNIRATRGEPLFGTVYTSKGSFTGFIQWDKYKYLDAHQLNGKINGVGPVKEYPFYQIEKIKKNDNAVDVIFKNGKERQLKGTSDTGPDIRGIVVMHPIFGRAVIDWKAFESVRFSKQPENGVSYADYRRPKRLKAQLLTTSNKRISGTCIFDLDEEWDMEMLEGHKDGVHYQLPFHQISKIKPHQNRFTTVVLKNGKTLSLGWENDVSDNNWGVIIRAESQDYQYITWDKIKEIEF